MAALGAHIRLVLDLDGNHLEDARSAATERSALLQFDAARYRPAAAASRRTAGARYAEARVLSHGDDGHQAAARLDGDAPRAAADRARQAGELLFEGRRVAEVVARVERSVTRGPVQVDARTRIALRSIRATPVSYCNGECGAGSMM